VGIPNRISVNGRAILINPYESPNL